MSPFKSPAGVGTSQYLGALLAAEYLGHPGTPRLSKVRTVKRSIVGFLCKLEQGCTTLTLIQTIVLPYESLKGAPFK